MKVEQVMTRDVKMVCPDDTLNEAARVMWDNACGCLPVVDGDDHVLGILTDRDICMAAYTQGRRLTDLVVGSAMSRQVHACHVGDALETAEHIMRAQQVRRLPVLGFDDRLVGILSLDDIAWASEHQPGKRSRDLSPETVGATLAAVVHARSH